MMNSLQNRRRFMSIAGFGTALMATPWSRSWAAGPRDADLVVFNASVTTVDPALPKAEAFAIRNGRFIAVGKSDEIRGLIGKGTRTYDAKGMAIVPGFIDTHNHPDGETLLYEVLVGNPFDVEYVTIDSIIEKLRERAKITPPGTWVSGYFYDDTKVKDGRGLNILDLDKVSTDHPVSVTHRGGHSAIYNGKAFKLAGVTRDTPNPFGGTYDRDASGDLNGRVTDLAMNVLDKVGHRPTYSPVERLQRARDGLAHISKEFVRYGLTTVHHQGGDLQALQQIRAHGDLRHRVRLEVYEPMLEVMIQQGIRSGFGDEWLRLGATAEHTVDGSFSERTMAMSVPYKGMDSSYRGNVTQTQEELNDWVERVHRAGIQVNCHANGDVAIDMYLTAFERAQQLFPVAGARPKITHCTMVNPNLLRRMKALDAVPSVFSTYAYYNSDKFHFYGEDLMQNMMPYRSFLDYGITPSTGSDFPPGPFAPLMALQGMVTRTGWNGETWGANQRVSIDEALRIATLGGAYNAHEEGEKGSIAVGKLADYVVLADDLASVSSNEIKDVPIVQTVTGGNPVFEA